MHPARKVIFLVCDGFWITSSLKTGVFLFARASVSLAHCLTQSSYHLLNEEMNGFITEFFIKNHLQLMKESNGREGGRKRETEIEAEREREKETEGGRE